MPVYLRIIVNVKRADMSMHVAVSPSNWSSNSGRAIGNSKKIRNLNSLLDSAQFTIYEKYNYLRETGKKVTALSVKNSYLGIVPDEEKGKKHIDFSYSCFDRLVLRGYLPNIFVEGSVINLLRNLGFKNHSNGVFKLLTDQLNSHINKQATKMDIPLHWWGK